MPSLIDLRRRVRAVKNTQQITKAMKMVAASKLRRSQERITSARPYAIQMQRVLSSVAAQVTGGDDGEPVHPLLTVRKPVARTLVIVVSGDKGLCGSFNTNVIKAASSYLASSLVPCSLALVGRKGRDYFVRRGGDSAFELTGLFQHLKYEHAKEIAQFAMDSFIDGRFDRVMLVYNEFKSVMSQRLVVDQLLPIGQDEVSGVGEDRIPATGGGDYLYEPSAEEIFRQLLPRYVQVQVARALLESNAAFYAAQMTAMDTATKNSAEMIGSLTLYMNKVRQAAITREIIEVVSGAQAL
jgi:F-type H+-transporting ATPase subunit gamma